MASSLLKKRKLFPNQHQQEKKEEEEEENNNKRENPSPPPPPPPLSRFENLAPDVMVNSIVKPHLTLHDLISMCYVSGFLRKKIVPLLKPRICKIYEEEGWNVTGHTMAEDSENEEEIEEIGYAVDTNNMKCKARKFSSLLVNRKSGKPKRGATFVLSLLNISKYERNEYVDVLKTLACRDGHSHVTLYANKMRCIAEMLRDSYSYGYTDLSKIGTILEEEKAEAEAKLEKQKHHETDINHNENENVTAHDEKTTFPALTVASSYSTHPISKHTLPLDKKPQPPLLHESDFPFYKPSLCYDLEEEEEECKKNGMREYWLLDPFFKWQRARFSTYPQPTGYFHKNCGDLWDFFKKNMWRIEKGEINDMGDRRVWASESMIEFIRSVDSGLSAFRLTCLWLVAIVHDWGFCNKKTLFRAITNNPLELDASNFTKAMICLRHTFRRGNRQRFQAYSDDRYHNMQSVIDQVLLKHQPTPHTFLFVMPYAAGGDSIAPSAAPSPFLSFFEEMEALWQAFSLNKLVEDDVERVRGSFRYGAQKQGWFMLATLYKEARRKQKTTTTPPTIETKEEKERSYRYIFQTFHHKMRSLSVLELAKTLYKSRIIAGTQTLVDWSGKVYGDDIGLLHRVARVSKSLFLFLRPPFSFSPLLSPLPFQSNKKQNGGGGEAEKEAEKEEEEEKETKKEKKENNVTTTTTTTDDDHDDDDGKKKEMDWDCFQRAFSKQHQEWIEVQQMKKKKEEKEKNLERQKRMSKKNRKNKTVREEVA